MAFREQWESFILEYLYLRSFPSIAKLGAEKLYYREKGFK